MKPPPVEDPSPDTYRSEDKYRLKGTSQQSKSLGAIARREALASGDRLGQLDPEWVEWLMGFPAGWTELLGAI